MPLLIFAAIGAVFSAVFAFSKKDINDQNLAWKAAGTALGLTFRDASLARAPRLTGTVRGVLVEATTLSRGNGNSSQIHTRFELTFPSVGPPVKMRSQTVGLRLGSMLGITNDVLVGSPEFDDRVVIDANDSDAIKIFLSPARQSVVLWLFEHFRYVMVTNNSFGIERRGRIKTPQAMTATINQLVDMALVLGAPTDVDVALQRQQDGMLGEAISDLHAINDEFAARGEQNSYTQLLEAEAAMAYGDGAAATAALAGVDPDGVLDVDEWNDVANRHLIPPIPPMTSSAPPMPPSSTVTAMAVPSTPEPPVDLGPSPSVLIEDLLQSNRTGSETEDRFLDTYAGQVVRWSGTVDSERPFRYDSDFDGEGVRGVLTIGSLGEGVLITNRVQAIVGLAPGSELTRGDEVTVEGTLIRFDRYMRNFYLADAIVVSAGHR